MSKNKEAVGNLGEEEMAFLKYVRKTRDTTRDEANNLFSSAHQTRARDNKLMNKLFVQFPAAQAMSHNLLKEASAEQFEQFEKIKIAYNTHHFFEAGAHLTEAQKRYPELQKVAGSMSSRKVAVPKKTPSADSPTGETGTANASGVNV